MIEDSTNRPYKLPDDVLKAVRTAFVSNPSADGSNRAKNLLREKQVMYGELKRLKNLFEPEHDHVKCELAGGELRRNFVEETLNQVRNANDRSTERREEVTVDR